MMTTIPGPVPSRTAKYRAFVHGVRVERGDRCEACGRSAVEARQTVLHVHHLWPIAKSGILDALVTCRANVLLVCDWCHAMQHPARRSWPWLAVGAARGRALR